MASKSTVAAWRHEYLRLHPRTTRTRLLDPPHVRRGSPAEGRARPENICDFTLGNPDLEPPPQVLELLRRVAAESRPHSHAYMPNAGYPAVREKVAAHLRRKTGLDFTADDILMTVGSAGACNTFLRSVLDPGDEVIVLMPYFTEYRFYIENHAGRVVPVETGEDFLPDIGRIAAAITPRTKAILLNSPNNPTGRVYRKPSCAS